VMVRVPLDAEHHRRADRIPAVQVVDTLVHSIFVFLAQQSVVLDVVDCFEVDDTPESVDHLMAKAVPPEDHVDYPGEQAVNEAGLNHLVVHELGQVRLLRAKLALDASGLSVVDSADVSGHRANNKSVNAHVLWTGGRVLKRSDRFMMALNMLVKEMSIEELGVRERTDDLVV
jgi:hypothetical protein